MVKPDKPMPDNIVTFKVDPRMTDWDIKNYLEKIYKVQIGSIQSRIMAGSLKRIREGLTKRDDYRLVSVTLPIGKTFKWPDLFPEDKAEEQQTDMDKSLKLFNEGRTMDPNIRVPGWISKFNK